MKRTLLRILQILDVKSTRLQHYGYSACSSYGVFEEDSCRLRAMTICGRHETAQEPTSEFHMTKYLGIFAYPNVEAERLVTFNEENIL
jgi:hypothetical protein